MKRIKRFCAITLRVIVALLVLYASGLIWMPWSVNHIREAFALEPNTVYQKDIVTVEAERGVPPILQKICKAESGCNHFDKNGQVLINHTYDVGAYQINVKIWGKKATELHLDLYNEKDNEAFALWLFENYGSEPWSPSKAKWSK